MRAAAAALVLVFVAPAFGQTSEKYRLTEATFNAGGRPADGVFCSSPNYRATLDSLGEGPTGMALAGASYRLDGGFVAAYPPPSEVIGLRFADRDTLNWLAERSIGTYGLYRDLVTRLSGLTYGKCWQSGLTEPAADDPGRPPAGNGYFYLITARNRLREEGTKGRDSSGAERNNSYPCP